MSLGSIPWTAINEYCREHRIEGELRGDMFHHVRALDNAYLEYIAKKSKTKSGKPQ